MAQLSIASPVGVGCINNRDDMTVVLDLLRVRRLEPWYQGQLSGLALPSPKEGKPLEALCAAVKLFQAKAQGIAKPDGIVSPNGARILFLGGLHTIGKQIIVDLDQQLLYAYEGTKRVYEFDCASGDTEHPTAEQPALFEVLRREKIYRSKKYDAQMNYALFFSADGKAIHQSNVVGLTSFLKKWGANYFGSHGCVRLSEENAQVLFAWTTPKTQVFIDMSRKAFS